MKSFVSVTLLRHCKRQRFYAFEPFRCCKHRQIQILLSSRAQHSTVPSKVIQSPSLSCAEIQSHQNELFNAYKKKVMAAAVPRIEKIQVNYKGRSLADDAAMLMNKGLSTPRQCAMHISQRAVNESILAFVKKSSSPEKEDGEVTQVKNEVTGNETPQSDPTENALSTEVQNCNWIPWDMHRPLLFDCDLRLLKFDTSSSLPEDEKFLNQAYWRSCALVLGAVAQEAFDDDLDVKLAHLPDVPEESGAFCYDIELSKLRLNADGSSKWKPDENTLIALTKSARHLMSQNLAFERLEVHKDDARDIFQHNEHMLARVDQRVFLSAPSNHVPVYRFGRYIDICEGPLVPSTSVMFHFVVTAVHQLRQDGVPFHRLWRFQGLSLPKELRVHHAIWAMLEHRARNLVKSDLPFKIAGPFNFATPLHKYSSIENKSKLYNIATGQWLKDKWDSSTKKIKVPTEQGSD